MYMNTYIILVKLTGIGQTVYAIPIKADTIPAALEKLETDTDLLTTGEVLQVTIFHKFTK